MGFVCFDYWGLGYCVVEFVVVDVGDKKDYFWYEGLRVIFGWCREVVVLWLMNLGIRFWCKGVGIERMVKCIEKVLSIGYCKRWYLF